MLKTNGADVVRRIPIRAKVAGAVAVPLVALAVAAWVGVSANAAQASRVADQAELATASIGHAGLISALQNERNQALIQMLGLSGRIALEVDDLDAARDQTDAAFTHLHHQIAGQSDTLREDYAEALRSLDALPDVRARVDTGLVAPGVANRQAAHDVFLSYTTMIATIFASHDRFSLVVDDAELRQGDDLIHFSSHATDAVAQLVDSLLYIGAGPGGVDEPVEAAEIAQLRRDVDKNDAVVKTKGTGPYADAAQTLLANPRVAGISSFAARAIGNGGAVDADALLATTPLGPEGGYLQFRDAVVAVLDAQAVKLAHEADVRRQIVLGAALAVVAAAILIALFISRSITRPLRDLSRKARAMATYRLPAAVQDILDAPPGEDIVLPTAEPIVVPGRDEVGDVAGALNDVQQSALELAVEQAALRRNIAESYVNLGRRNQNLLSRLLDVVGELERVEADPARLEKLYKLDHLATRIRRNAESLLVLSETQAPARWQPPVQIDDVVRAALGEIENYERVLVRTLEPTMVMGGASSDLAHLLAELIENGLRHSPPRELVEVTGRATADGYSLAIVDHGLGMTPEDLERANQRLAGVESFTVTPAKYLGHYVTAVLAARHGIKVRLQGSVVVGIAAQVDLPAAMLTDRVERSGMTALAASRAEPDHEPAWAGAPEAPAWAGAPEAHPGLSLEDTPGERPTPEDVRAAVALVRTRSATPPRAPGAGRAPMAPVPLGPTVVPTHRPVRVEITASALERPYVTRALNAPAPAPLPPGPGPAPAIGTNARRAPFGSAGVWQPFPASPVPDAPGGEPQRTASGLVRRVRGAHARADAAAGGPGGTRTGNGQPTPAIDGEEMQRFLASLAGGVQRSLDQRATGSVPADEG
jgi:signal transduction histidine kinase